MALLIITIEAWQAVSPPFLVNPCASDVGRKEGKAGGQVAWSTIHNLPTPKGGQEAPLPTVSPWCQATEPKL